jgi:hypothetical protein
MAIFTAINYYLFDTTDDISMKRRFICYKQEISTYDNNQNITEYKIFNVKSLKSTAVRNYELLDEFSPSPFILHSLLHDVDKECCRKNFLPLENKVLWNL